MFGTVAQMKGLPGAQKVLLAWNQALTSGINGMIHSVMYRANDEPDVF